MNGSNVAVLLSTPLETQLDIDETGIVTLSVVIGSKTTSGPIACGRSSNSIAVQTTLQGPVEPESKEPLSLSHLPRHSRRRSSIISNRTSLLGSYEPLEYQPTENDMPRDETLDTELLVDLADPEAAKQLMQEIRSLQARKVSAEKYLADIDASWIRRRKPYESNLDSLLGQIHEKEELLEEAKAPKIHPLQPSGPRWLSFSASDWFGGVCNAVILMNVVSMAMQMEVKGLSTLFIYIDNLFLAWYVFELLAKIGYFQRSFLVGPVSVVWWAWLDLGIVGAGVVEQWLLPLFEQGGRVGPNMSFLRMLRLLRLFRLLRLLKLARLFLSSDLAWTNGAYFELFMGAVIAFNSIIMAFELDMPWAGWNYIEHMLLAIYSFELALRLKRDGWSFFVNYQDSVWNYIDIVTVVGGVLDLWLTPLIHMIAHPDQEHEDNADMARIVRLLKIIRILRVLRLVRLVKAIGPLYVLLLGVLESVQAMQWVIVLAFLTLYACAIIFTSLVGQGLATGGHITDAAEQAFGSVMRSLFALFRLMNGDLTVTQTITDSVTGQLLFVAFVVVSNWAILAILTSVVADNMILTSRNTIHDLREKKNKEEREQRSRRLRVIFDEVDVDGNGRMTDTEWKAMMDNPDIHDELCDATGFTSEQLNDYFNCLAAYSTRPPVRCKQPESERSLDYEHFLEMLKDESMVADRRCIWHVLSEIRALQSSFEFQSRRTRFEPSRKLVAM